VATSDASNAINVVVDTTSPDLGLVDALARLQLMARRRGFSITVRPCDELRALIELVGLVDVLALEPRRQPEGGIEVGVQEMVQPRDQST
jgi:hypothetical protein